MGVYTRNDSPFYWLLLERPAPMKAIKESSKVLRDAPDAMSRKLQRQEAERIYIARMNELARARYSLPVDRRTVGFSTHAAWFETHHLPRRKGAAREREILGRLKTYFGEKDLTTFTRQTAQEYITDRLGGPKPVSHATINREIDVLKAVLREAVPKYLDVNPLLGMARLKTARPKKGRVLTPAEERRLLEQLAPADRALFIVAVDTLLRLSNVLNLQWSEVKRGRLELTDSKTGPYTVALSTRAQEALAALPRDKPYCFPERRKAKTARDQRGTIRRILKRACDTAKPKIPYGRAIGGVTFHTATRATGATRMLRAGEDLRTVQKVGNWADLRSVQAYLEPNLKGERRAVNRIGRDVTPT
jgi:integrase